MKSLMRLWLILLATPLLGGCFAYVYPDVSSTPAVVVPADVRAFRSVFDGTQYGCVIAGAFCCETSVEEISVNDCKVAPERDSYCPYYYLMFPLQGGRRRTMTVLLYRPGYEVVEVPAQTWWQISRNSVLESVTWKPAPDLEAQKAALDCIASPDGHRAILSPDVLRFLQGEYARLADSPMAESPEMLGTREELRRLAGQYRELADKKLPQ